MTGGSVSTLNIVCGQRLVDIWSFGQEDGRGYVVKRHQLKGAHERGSLEVPKKPQDPTTEYVGPARVWCWEVTRRRDESVVHHRVIARERTANTQ